MGFGSKNFIIQLPASLLKLPLEACSLLNTPVAAALSTKKPKINA
jgi:hypothetical protein